MESFVCLLQRPYPVYFNCTCVLLCTASSGTFARQFYNGVRTAKNMETDVRRRRREKNEKDQFESNLLMSFFLIVILVNKQNIEEEMSFSANVNNIDEKTLPLKVIYMVKKKRIVEGSLKTEVKTRKKT